MFRAAHCVLPCAVAGVLSLGFATQGRGQAVDGDLWCAEPGRGVDAIAREGNTIYVGGNFLRIGPASGSGVPFDLSTGRPLLEYGKVAGKVLAAIPDGGGGWYIGGEFVAVGGKRRWNLAQVTADGRVGDWAPRMNGPVSSLALSGGRLYVGGQFDTVDTMRRSRLVALATKTGALLEWGPQLSGFSVDAILPRDGGVYLGGRFSSVGLAPRVNLAAIDSASGEVLPWRCDVDGWVQCLAAHDTALFVGGRYYYVAGESRRGLAAVGLSSGALLPWDAHIDRPYSPGWAPGAEALVVRDTVLYVAGSFTSIGGATRQGLAALETRSGLATSWNPRAYRKNSLGAFFTSIALWGDTLFVAGFWDSLGGVRGNFLAAVDANTGDGIQWSPQPNVYPWTLVVSQDRLYVGGAFTSILGQWEERRHLAAFDATTGRLLPWNPDANDYVGAIAARNGIVYVGGAFSSVGGQPRRALAALDATTGAATPWDPSPDGWGVWSLLPRGETVIVGGYFDHIGGQPRRSIAAVDSATGLATDWNPDLGPIVMCLVEGDSVIYAGGDFSFAEGQFRGGVAAIDPVTGVPRGGFPRLDGGVDAMTKLGGTLYVGGTFSNADVDVQATPRQRVAAIGPGGVVTQWRADADGRVRSLAAHGNTVYIGGDFANLGGLPRAHVAAVEADTGTVHDWNPGLDGSPWALHATDDVVYMGGGFSRAGLWPQAGFAAAESAEPRVEPPAPVYGLALAQSVPNPSVGQATIQYWLPTAAIAELAVFDLQGRRMASLASSVPQAAGPHAITVRTDSWPAGCYFYRLQANGRSLTRRMVVLK